jgi:hypothetical protein
MMLKAEAVFLAQDRLPERREGLSSRSRSMGGKKGGWNLSKKPAAHSSAFF